MGSAASKPFDRSVAALAVVAFAILVAHVTATVAGCGTKSTSTPLPPPHGLALTGYHGNAARTGWNDDEPRLTPSRVRGMSLSWSSPPFDTAVVAGVTYAPHLYASPLYLDDVAIGAPAFSGLTTSVVVVATSNGDVYALSAITQSSAAGPVAPGTILWRSHLGDPSQPLRSSDGVPLGILGTPVIDTSTTPPRLFVAAADATKGWQAFALDLSTGAVLPGWPVAIERAAVEGANVNRGDAGTVTFADFHTLSQRGALNLSADATVLYVPFGSYYDGAVGWMVAIDTVAARVRASFSGAPTDVTGTGPDANLASAGMWGASGVAVASDGHVLVTTGNSPDTSRDTPGVWGNSLLRWKLPLTLDGTYTPFNYCLLDSGDTDLGGGSPVSFDLDPARTSTPHLVAFGGKQGNAYLADRDALTGRLDRRPPCDPKSPPSPSTDSSLYGPDPRGYYAPPSRGPLNVFGPYSDAPDANDLNQAKSRTAPAFFMDQSGTAFLFYSGNSRDAADATRVVPPSIARIRIVTTPGAPAFLALDQVNATITMKNPGSPVVSSHASLDAVVWVLDENGQRTDPLVPGGATPAPLPRLYAFDATTLELLFQTDLPAPGGKYNHPTIAHGLAFVGADRLYAFGVE